MNWKLYLLLTLLGLSTATIVGLFQSSPGYMDADYYYAGGMQLANGHGFSEPYLWNYLDDPAVLPHPSHTYWMPLASILAAAGIILIKSSTWFAARMGFLIITALIPPVTAALAWSFTPRRDLALTSGLLAVFPAFYLSFLPVTDTFGIYMLIGGTFFLIINRRSSALNSLLLGILAGLMHLARADGVLWLLIAMLVVLFISPKPSKRRTIVFHLVIALAGYLMVLIPWFARNYFTLGTPFAPGSSKPLWLTTYDQLFSYPASRITFSNWWQSGLGAITRVRIWALGLNLSNMVSVQGEIFLLPFIALGLWHLRKDRRVQLAGFCWVITLAAMTILFPFAGARGGFFHSGASLQMIWWVLAPIGLDQVILWGSRKRGWIASQAGIIFRSGLVAIAALLTLLVIYSRVIGGGGNSVWDQEHTAYSQITSVLISKGMTNGEVVMVANPPGFFLASGNPAIAVPDGDVNTLLAAAKRYEGKYVILEEGATPTGLMTIYDNPENASRLHYLGDVHGAHLYAIQP
jgi:hypothetical protein